MHQLLHRTMGSGGSSMSVSLFSLPGQSPVRAIVLPSALAAASALAKSLTLKFFYVMGKVLSGKLSCPCDRSCCNQF